MDQIDANNSQCLLLPHILFIEHSKMDEDFRRVRAGLSLKADSHPAVAFLFAGGYSIGEDEKGGFISPFFMQALPKQVVFVLEHGLKATATDIAIGGAINGITNG